MPQGTYASILFQSDDARLPAGHQGTSVMMRGNAWQLGASDALFSLTTRAGNFILL
jgi:hypothetical protein